MAEFPKVYSDDNSLDDTLDYWIRRSGRVRHLADAEDAIGSDCGLIVDLHLRSPHYDLTYA